MPTVASSAPGVIIESRTCNPRPGMVSVMRSDVLLTPPIESNQAKMISSASSEVRS